MKLTREELNNINKILNDIIQDFGTTDYLFEIEDSTPADQKDRLQYDLVVYENYFKDEGYEVMFSNVNTFHEFIDSTGSDEDEFPIARYNILDREELKEDKRYVDKIEVIREINERLKEVTESQDSESILVEIEQYTLYGCKGLFDCTNEELEDTWYNLFLEEIIVLD